MFRNMLLLVALMAASIGHASAAPAKLKDVFQRDMLDVDLAYFENIAGPARKTYGDEKQYVVEGCNITTTVRGGSVRALRMELTPKCSFDLGTFITNFAGKFPPANKLTHGAFDKVVQRGARFYADCLYMCGNGYDPSIYEHWTSSRADDVLDVMLETKLVGIPALDASDEWEEVMLKAEGEDYVMDNKFNCSPRHDAVAHKAFAQIPVTAITIGWDVTPPGCD